MITEIILGLFSHFKQQNFLTAVKQQHLVDNQV